LGFRASFRVIWRKERRTAQAETQHLAAQIRPHLHASNLQRRRNQRQKQLQLHSGTLAHIPGTRTLACLPQNTIKMLAAAGLPQRACQSTNQAALDGMLLCYKGIHFLKFVFIVFCMILHAVSAGPMLAIGASNPTNLLPSRVLASTTTELFVSTTGSDDNAGDEPTLAFASVGRALFAARASLSTMSTSVSIKVTNGSFVKSSSLDLPSNVSLAGSFHADFYSQYYDVHTVINLAPGTSLTCEKQSSIRIEALQFSVSTLSEKQSSITAHFKECQQVLIHIVTFSASAASLGNAGAPGASGVAGRKKCTQPQFVHLKTLLHGIVAFSQSLDTVVPNQNLGRLGERRNQLRYSCNFPPCWRYWRHWLQRLLQWWRRRQRRTTQLCAGLQHLCG